MEDVEQFYHELFEVQSDLPEPHGITTLEVSKQLGRLKYCRLQQSMLSVYELLLDLSTLDLLCHVQRAVIANRIGLITSCGADSLSIDLHRLFHLSNRLNPQACAFAEEFYLLVKRSADELRPVRVDTG